MKQLIKAFGDAIVGVSSGFDRIVFQGMIRPVMYPEGAMGFFDRRRIRFKDARKWVLEQTERLVSAVEECSLKECGEGITYLPSSKIRKETVARQLEQAGVGFERLGNKILHLDDFDAMQPLLDQQLRTSWCSLLDSFVPIAFPTITSTLGTDLRYTWTLWQSEWASDLMFKDRRDLDEVMNAVVRHAFIGGHPERLLRYFGHPVKKNGQPRRSFGGSLKTTVIDLDEGYRIRHWHGSNSVKLYNEVNILRIESTINNPGAFRAYRHKQGAGKDAAKELLPLRKGVADTTLRAWACQGINDRFADHGVIRRLPKVRRYQLTALGRQLVTTLQAALAASAQELMALAA